jgi:hypothetical protein
MRSGITFLGRGSRSLRSRVRDTTRPLFENRNRFRPEQNAVATIGLTREVNAMEPYTDGNQPLRQPLPQQPQLQQQQTGEMQIDKSTSNPMPIVAALGILAAIVLGWVLFSNPQGTETASYNPPAASDPVRTVEPKQPPGADSQRPEQLKEKVEPEK